MSEYHLDPWTWLNSVQMRTSMGSRWMSNNYIDRCHRRPGSVSSSQFQLQLEIGCPRSEKQLHTEGFGPQRTMVEQPSQDKEECCYGRENFVSKSSSLCPSPAHLLHITNINPFTTLSRIKCERYIFLKKCVFSFIEVRIWCFCWHLHV